MQGSLKKTEAEALSHLFGVNGERDFKYLPKVKPATV